MAFRQLRLRFPERPWLIHVRFEDCEIPDRNIGDGRAHVHLAVSGFKSLAVHL